MGRTRGKRGVSQVGDASGIMEAERTQGGENVLMAGNTPCLKALITNQMQMKAEDSTHIYRTPRRRSEASPLTPR
jgi:hypothetical protein